MSKTSVGDVYAKVIKEVCEQSRIDFEEGGVELATLDLLQSEWQKKLSQLKVTHLPWDPAPALPSKETTLPSNAKPPQPQTLPSNGKINTSTSQAGPSLPPIKREPQNYPLQAPPQQPYTIPPFPQGQPHTAKDRAIMNLHQNYGERAGAQIAHLQQAGQPRVPMAQQMPNPSPFIKQEDNKANLTSLDDYGSSLPQDSGVPIKSSQTDGAGEWDNDYNTKRKALVAQHCGGADRLTREHFRSTQQQLEGGGLLLPLDERCIMENSLKRKVMELAPGFSSATSPSEHAGGPSSLGRAQGDATGDDDDDEEDENAINSDLDDPDELAAAEENGENTDQVMLCTYDKVARVKNKWKCTLKDGVLRVEGNEYVFHKGQGEFEW